MIRRRMLLLNQAIPILPQDHRIHHLRIPEHHPLIRMNNMRMIQLLLLPLPAVMLTIMSLPQ